MRNFILLVFMAISFVNYSQQGTTITDSIMHDGAYRSYIIYIPVSYNASTAAPLVFNFHGRGSNAIQQYYYGDFREIADTAGFLVVHPEGTVYQGGTHWNVGGFVGGSTIDDVGFTEALLDTLINQYNINQARIYSTGMSNGGYMSFHLACELSSRITAVASVTGSMTPYTYSMCNPLHPTPVLQVHGTLDATVPYNGDTWTQSIDEVLTYWSGHNQCDTNPTISDIPNSNPLDQSTVKKYVYNNGLYGSTVEHFKVIGGGHTWPGFSFGIAGTNYDMDASIEIWRFFSQYDLNALSSLKEISTPEITISPNPFKESFSISSSKPMFGNYSLIDATGKKLLSNQVAGETQLNINAKMLDKGIYYLVFYSEQNELVSHKLIKQ